MKTHHLFVPMFLSACTATPRAEEPIKNPPTTREAPGAGKTIVAKPLAKLSDEACVQLDKLPGQPPVVVVGKNIVLTKVLKTCVTHAGLRGYDKASPYLAMGFPCTGGSGRIEVKGHYNNPNLITFLLGTDCGMAPSSKDNVQELLASSYGLPGSMKLAAYTPFVVQYWEVVGMSDADVGYGIELRQAPATEGLWHRFQQHEPVHVRLYGRENTWVQGDNFYFVEGDLKMTGRTAFQLEVTQVKPLSKDETGVVRSRCEALRPKRNCTDVF